MEDPPSLLCSSAATQSLASSPEHSRARHLRPRAAERLSSGRLGRRREGYGGEENRRGRSWTRSVSPSEVKAAIGAAKREPRKGMRRRSRSPSRSSVGEDGDGDGGESPILKRQKTGEEEKKGDESVSSRSRSKRRRKYRRRSDYAAAAAARGDVRRLLEEDEENVMEEVEVEDEDEEGDEDEDENIAVEADEPAHVPAHVPDLKKKSGLRDKFAAKMGGTGRKTR